MMKIYSISILCNYLKQKLRLFFGCSFTNVTSCCFSLFFVTLNRMSFSFGLLVGQNKTFKNVILSIFSLFYRLND